MRVDVWMQHPTVRFAQHEMFAPLLRWTGLEPPTEPVPVELTVAAMDEAGIDVGLLTAWHGPGEVLISNDEVAASVAEAPDRLVGVASVDLRRPVDAVHELRRCVQQLGFRALRVLPWWWDLPPNDRRYYPLYLACVELDIPFCLQIGHAGPLAPSEPGRPIPYLDDVAREFPELTIVAGHIGYPWTDEAVALATKYPNVFLDTSAYTARRYPSVLVEFLRGHGAGKVLFGSNYPMITPGRALEDLDDLELDEPTRQRFLGGTARRVFGLEDLLPGS